MGHNEASINLRMNTASVWSTLCSTTHSLPGEDAVWIVNAINKSHCGNDTFGIQKFGKVNDVKV